MIGLMVLSIGLISASEDDDSMEVTVNVIETSVGISVPEKVYFQDITKGYISERHDLKISNTGTTDIVVTPLMEENYTGKIFDNIVFQKVLSDDYTKIKYFDFDVERPTTVGGTNTDNIYMYLDLVDFEDDTTNEPDHTGNVIFWATSK